MWVCGVRGGQHPCHKHVSQNGPFDFLSHVFVARVLEYSVSIAGGFSGGMDAKLAFVTGSLFSLFLGVVNVKTKGCFPLTYHLRGDFDHGKILGPV